MATKKTTPAKKAPAAAAAKKKAAAPAKAGASKGAKYSCEVCGLVVTVDEVCGCVDVCDIVCCGETMAPAKKPAKKKAAK
ncbi:MAG: hypothetical protein HW414_227 [Dehalococcoidia bacterium]|nr:hypothetical protein [Dehalococcoidia bacterium]